VFLDKLSMPLILSLQRRGFAPTNMRVSVLVWRSGMIAKELLEILACPKCKAEVRLDEGAQRIICVSPTCGLRYPIRDGIPVMLIDEAEKPSAA